MRLLRIDDCDTLSLSDDLVDNIPPYAILSHTWGLDHEEVTLEVLRDGSGKSRAGYAKLQFCGKQARKDNLEYFWVDTCCIDKANHSELTEALNSMFRWYGGAEKCYVYLFDVSVRKHETNSSTEQTWESAFRNSRWFTRGWTLQELLAPASVDFFSREGQFLGSKHTLDVLIQDISRIPVSALRGNPLANFSFAERTQWSAKRNTRRTEDKVYCLLGIFDVFMVPMYGEGEKNAMSRFKDELARSYRNQLDGVGESSTFSESRDFHNRDRDSRRELLASLAFEQMDSRRRTIKSAYSTTCKWLLTHPVYIAWTDLNKLRDHNGFFWIKGKPGAGKSTLVKFAYMHADRERAKDDIIISFFFNARGEELERTTIGMYRALLFQLLNKAPDLQDICEGIYASSEGEDAYRKWTIGLLCDCLRGTISALGHRRLKCFIDALDECDEQQIQEMIVFFEELGQDALNAGTQVYLCFASRHYPTINIRSGCQLTVEDECGHSDDLAKYVRCHLRAGTGKYVEEVRTSILEKANGVFIWVVLVVDILNVEFRTGRIFAVKKRLSEIPAKLGNLFKAILKRDHANMNDLLLCLQWILFAKRPLGPEEFYYAMVASLAPEPENIAEWDPERITPEHMSRFILNSSKGLAELTKSKAPTVQFIHESVRDFLIKDGGLSELWPQFGDQLHSASHEQLKQSCLKYLDVNASGYAWIGNSLPKASSDAAKDLRQRLNSKFPFLEYATRYVLYHADEAASQISQDNFLRNFDIKTWLDVSNQLERYEVRRYTPTASLGYILAEHNHARLINAARHCGYSLKSRGERYHFPLFAAIANGHRTAVRTLLQQNENSLVEEVVASLSFGREFSVPKDRTPLLWALETGHETLAEILVTSNNADLCLLDCEDQTAFSMAATKGYEGVVNLLLTCQTVDVNARDEVSRTALSHAAQQGRATLVKLLLEKGADTNTPDNGGYTALMYAVRYGKEAVVQLLIEKGADIEASDNDGCTALIWAVRTGDKEVVQLLLEQGANIHASDNHGKTALIWAAFEGREAVVQLLLEQGANIAASDHRGKTALILAALAGREAVVQVLLEQGANIEASDNNGHTALIWAAFEGREAVVQLLLEQGANIEASGHRGKTALILAALNGGEAVVQVLLEQGANIEASDNNGHTALIWAAFEGREAVVQLLLEQGANIEASDNNGYTALIKAASNWNEAVVQVLLEQGANIEASDNNGCTALIWAALSGRRAVVQVLLEQGANIEASDNDGCTALMLANGHQRVVQLLLEQGAKIKASDDRGRTAQTRAARNGDEAVV